MTKRKQAKIFCFNLQCCHLNSTSHLILLSFSDQIQPVSINLKGERAGGGGGVTNGLNIVTSCPNCY